MSRYLLLNLEDFGLNQAVMKTIEPLNPFCICCLDKEGPMFDLKKCEHSDYLNAYERPQLKQYKQLVCIRCHSMLKKIMCFQAQVLESYDILCSGVFTDATTNSKKLNSLNVQKVVHDLHLPPDIVVEEDFIGKNFQKNQEGFGNITQSDLNMEQNFTNEIHNNSSLEQKFIQEIHNDSDLEPNYTHHIQDNSNIEQDFSHEFQVDSNMEHSLIQELPNDSNIRSFTHEILDDSNMEQNFTHTMQDDIKMEQNFSHEMQNNSNLDKHFSDDINDDSNMVQNFIRELPNDSIIEQNFNQELQNNSNMEPNFAHQIPNLLNEEENLIQEQNRLNKNIKTALEILERNNQNFVSLGSQLQFLNGEHLSFLETSLLSKEILTDIPLVISKNMSTDLENGLLNNSKSLEIEIDGTDKMFYDSLDLSPELVGKETNAAEIMADLDDSKANIIIKEEEPMINNITTVQPKKKRIIKSANPSDLIKRVRLSHEDLDRERVLQAQSDAYLRYKFRCETCIVSFNYKENLDDHIKRKHGLKEEHNIVCDICCQLIRDAGHVTEHNYRHYTRYECVRCKRRHHTHDEALQHCIKKHGVNAASNKKKKPTAKYKKTKLKMKPSIA